MEIDKLRDEENKRLISYLRAHSELKHADKFVGKTLTNSLLIFQSNHNCYLTPKGKMIKRKTQKSYYIDFPSYFTVYGSSIFSEAPTQILIYPRAFECCEINDFVANLLLQP